MILKALYDYYQLLKNEDPTLPEVGMKQQEIHFVIVIDQDGNLVRIEDRMISKKEAQKFKVVADSRSSDIKPYSFYDNLEYLFGMPKDGKIDKAKQRNAAYIAKCRDLAQKYPENIEFQSVVRFYENNGPKKVIESSEWNAMVSKTGANVSFMLDKATTIVASSNDLANEIDLGNIEGKNSAPCLITGQKCIPVELTTATMIPGSQAVAKLVSFQEKSGYDSYGKNKCYNSPISKVAESAYSTALLTLLGKNSKNKFLVGNRTFVFWGSSSSEASKTMVNGLFSLFGIQGKDDDPTARVALVRDSFKAIYTGKIPSPSTDRFYILGLAPNAARIAVVYWQETSVRDFAANILRHFDDMDIYDNRSDSKPHSGIHQIIAATTVSRKASDGTPNLPESTIKSILNGTPYPFALYSAVLRRIRAELDKNEGLDRYFFKVRIAILKAYINRTTNQIKLKSMLDSTSTNLGYLCGRLFAVLVYAQQKASNTDSLKPRYMNSASSTPAAVFGTLLNLSVHHTDKLDRGKGFIEKIKQEIIDLLPASGFPAHLSLEDQGRFFVGYYQQTTDLWTKKTTESETTSEN